MKKSRIFREIYFSFTTNFLFVLVTMAIFQVYPPLYTFSKLIIFLTKSQQHININWEKKKRKEKQTNKQTNSKITKLTKNVCSMLVFKLSPLCRKLKLLHLQLVYNNNNNKIKPKLESTPR